MRNRSRHYRISSFSSAPSRSSIYSPQPFLSLTTGGRYVSTTRVRTHPCTITHVRLRGCFATCLPAGNHLPLRSSYLAGRKNSANRHQSWRIRENGRSAPARCADLSLSLPFPYAAFYDRTFASLYLCPHSFYSVPRVYPAATRFFFESSTRAYTPRESSSVTRWARVTS